MNTAVTKGIIVNLSIGLGLSVGLMAQTTYTVSTVAGTYSLDDTSIFAPMSSPSGVAVDSAGNVYFSDAQGNRVRKISATTGLVTTIAGTGAFGKTGDAGPGVKALLNSPAGLALDGAGNLYIADSGNHTVRKLDPTGLISLYAGTPGSGGFAGDGRAANQARLKNPRNLFWDSVGNNLFIADKENNRVRKVDSKGIIHTVAGSGGNSTTASGGLSGDADPSNNIRGNAVNARLGQPQGVAVDSNGNIYIADTANNRVRRVSVAKNAISGAVNDAAGIITTVAGVGAPGPILQGAPLGDGNLGTSSTLSGPQALAVDSNNNLYIADTGNGRIRFLNTSSDHITTFVSGLSGPSSIVLDGAGNLLVAESGGDRIRKISLADGSSTILAGGSAGAAFGTVRGLTTDAANNLVVADTSNHRIRKISASDGSMTTLAGITGSSGFSGDTAAAVGSRISNPWGGTYDAAGNYYFADRGNNRVRKIDASGVINTIAGNAYTLRTYSQNGTSCGGPTGASGCSNTNISPGYYGDGLPAVQAQLNAPSSVAVDSLGNVYIADSGNNVIRRVDPTGVISTFAGFAPACAAIKPETTAPAGNSTVNGTSTSPLCKGIAGADGDGLPAIQAQLNNPLGVAVDGNNNVYICDTNNHSIRVVNSSGIITTVVGITGSNGGGGDNISGELAQLDTPQAIATDTAGNVYIADQNNLRIRKYDASTGLVKTIAGTGTTLAADGLDSLKAEIVFPLSVAVDSTGAVYYSDTTKRISKLTPGK